MKRFLLISSAAAMLLASCSDEMSDKFGLSGGDEELIRIYASISDKTEENTRTSLGAMTDTGFPYKWDDADAIGVFPVSEDGTPISTTNAIFKYDAANKVSGKTAFLGTPQILRYDDIWSYYPWSANTTVKNNSVIELNIRPYQNYNFSAVPENSSNSANGNGALIPNGSFAQGEAPSVAWGSLSMADDNSYTFDLQFEPLAGYLTIPIVGEAKVSNVAITVRVGEEDKAEYVQLSGKLNIDMSKGKDSLGNPGFDSANGTYATIDDDPTPENGGMVIVECGRGVQLDPETPTWFWFVVPANLPTTKDTHVDIYVEGIKKFTYTFNRAEGKTEITKNMTLSLTDSQKAFEYKEEAEEEEEDDELFIHDDMTVAFPDEGFRNYVLQNFDTNNDGKISKEEALVVKEINCSGESSSKRNIYSLEGIQYFPNLTKLECRYCKINSLDLSKNTSLTYLDCYGNQLTTLDVSKNTSLTYLECAGNKITTLDISKNTALTYLSCGSNGLTTLDMSKNTALTYLSCGGNPFTTLDLSKNTALTTLYCTSIQLTTLDLSKNTALTYLNCSFSQLTTLDLSKNTALTDLICEENKLTTLDVRGCTALTNLSLRIGQLTSLDVSKNTQLTTLNCGGNQLSSLDVTQNTVLEVLACASNKLTTLDVSKNTALTTLHCFYNQLTSLDVSQNTALTILYCAGQGNNLMTLDVSQNTALEKLDCSSNILRTLDVSKNTKLSYLKCTMNRWLSTLYVKNGQTIDNITPDRNTNYIDGNTQIVYVE